MTYSKAGIKRHIASLTCRDPGFEKEVLDFDFDLAYLYAKKIIKGTWPEFEQAISKSLHDKYDEDIAFVAVKYAVHVKKDRFKEIESVLVSDIDMLYYAEWTAPALKYFIKLVGKFENREWPEFRDKIVKKGCDFMMYAQYTGNKYPEIEDSLRGHDLKTYNQYCINGSEVLFLNQID